jgi:hypothetical protein
MQVLFQDVMTEVTGTGFRAYIDEQREQRQDWGLGGPGEGLMRDLAHRYAPAIRLLHDNSDHGNVHACDLFP